MSCMASSERSARGNGSNRSRNAPRPPAASAHATATTGSFGVSGRPRRATSAAASPQPAISRGQAGSQKSASAGGRRSIARRGVASTRSATAAVARTGSAIANGRIARVGTRKLSRGGMSARSAVETGRAFIANRIARSALASTPQPSARERRHGTSAASTSSGPERHVRLVMVELGLAARDGGASPEDRGEPVDGALRQVRIRDLRAAQRARRVAAVGVNEDGPERREHQEQRGQTDQRGDDERARPPAQRRPQPQQDGRAEDGAVEHQLVAGEEEAAVERQQRHQPEQDRHGARAGRGQQGEPRHEGQQADHERQMSVTQPPAERGRERDEHDADQPRSSSPFARPRPSPGPMRRARRGSQGAPARRRRRRCRPPSYPARATRATRTAGTARSRPAPSCPRAGPGGRRARSSRRPPPPAPRGPG